MPLIKLDKNANGTFTAVHTTDPDNYPEQTVPSFEKICAVLADWLGVNNITPGV